MEFIKKFLSKISSSLNSQTPISSVRTQSYMVLFPIVLMVMVFLIIEIWSFIHAIYTGKEYVLSNEIIVVYGMLLSHHLAILFSRTKSQGMAELKGTSTEELPTDKPPVNKEEEPVI